MIVQAARLNCHTVNFVLNEQYINPTIIQLLMFIKSPPGKPLVMMYD